MNCLVTTQEIRELAKNLKGETVESVKGLISLWQEQNKKSIEEYPTIEELSDFKTKLRNSETTQMLDEAISSFTDATGEVSTIVENNVDLIFDPQTRRDRVSLIARFFSNEIDKATNEITESLKRRISEDSNSEDKFQLENQLANLSRFDVIKECTPKELFRRVLKIFEDYVNDTEENRIKAELDKINSTKGSEKYTDEQKLNAAQKRAEYKETAYRKIVDNYTALAEEASTLLVFSEGIRFDYDSLTPKKVNLNEEDLEGDSELDNQDDLLSKEESVKESWMVNYRLVSSHESLSQAVRKAIMQVPKLDYKGKYEKDDLGFTRYLDSNYVHAVLIDKLKDMITAEDMMPLMQELVSTKPWVKQVINLLQRDEALFSQFYQDFRKDFTPYWVQKKIMNPDGTFKMVTIAVNKPEGIYYLLDSWRDNYENGTLLDEDSVYNKNGTINIENAEKGLKWVETLNSKFSNLDTEARLKLLEEDRIWNTILKLLNMISIDANPSILKLALTDIKTIKGITFTDPIILLLHQLNIIFSGIKRGDIKSETLEDGTEKRGDLINTFGSAYNSIADMLAEVTEDAIESSISQTIDSKTKTFYSHTNPNYLGKLIKQLKNVRGDKERFENFINSEFKSWWFYKDGKWRNDWLKQLVNSPEMRKGLSHKVVLSSDRNSYTNWDSLDYTLALLTEYWGDPENSKTNVKWAWYHIPILSDSPSAEFIKFRKYVSGVEYDEDGNRLSYEDILLDKLVDLVNQEYDRIALVIARDKQIQEGKILPIANYDVTRDKYTGKVKSLGGAEFKFLPALNSIKYEDGETFINRLNRLKAESSGDELRTFIKDTLKEVMDNGFEDTYKEWTRIGLFTELPNGKYAYLPFNGQSQQNSKTVKALIKAKDILGDSWNSEMNNLLGNYNSNLPVVDNEANRIFEEIKDLIFEALKVGKVSVNEVNSINKDLVVKNRAKEALREYYWNSTFATSQIIQLTTTDLAFYKNLEDFQKRYKEVHAPSLRMNTKATYKGERIGRDWERTIYLKDDEITSSVLSDIETVLNERVKKGEMSKIDRDNIIYKFKAVNVADAQAYRSLSSYRAILGMSGQWTDEMERAFNNFKNGTWDISDFNIIWQTKKPYVYTQINNDSGVEGYDYIKTPVQHKNSEFLLLAMHELIAGPLGRSSKLKAINEFMEKHNIDVVQFESTTKVGKQGVIDINKVNTEKEVIQILEEATGISKGIENPSVVHKVSYEDYGIQTATPEHAIDAVQLVGTQIRKLITADISSDAIIKVDGKKMTKQEWLDLYNAINTENIIKSFRDIDEIFKDPKEVEKTLLDEIRGNQRYGVDMIKACTLNEDGQFNIPLFDPVQSQRVQTLLNSVIKSRITKQNIRGGALIQVSDYGLTDELHIVFEGEGENKRIKYMECYMPAYSRDFYEPLMDPETHQLDASKLPDDLRKLIGYRIPTEDKYSMAPLYIKGFLPQQNGSAIMLPAEITTLAGSDFDVDKLYIMLPEFKIEEYDFRRARQDFKGEQKIMDELASLFREGNLLEDFANAPIEFKKWFKENEEAYKLSTPKIKKVRYNFNKNPQENNPKARNNLLIDMMWGILTNPDTASKILNPGGFDYQKKAARIVSILKSSYEGDLRKELNIDRGPILPKLLALDLEDLDKLAQKSKKKLNPLAPNTQVYLHQQNMTGGKLIGIYANHNANHALMQHTELGLDSENGAFILNGKKLTSLHNIMNDDKEFISKNNAGFLAASVDNVKDPVLADINQNTFTADAAMLLSRLGYNPIEIGLLMAQPIIVDITQTYFKESREGKDKDTILDEILNKYKEKASMMEEITYDNYKENKFLIEDLANYILIEKEMSSLTSAHQTTDYNKVEFYKKQVAVGFLFKRIMNAANSLGQLVQATRADTNNGAAGPTIADTIIKVQKVKDFLDKAKNDDEFPLIGADVLDDFISVNEAIEDPEERIDEVRERLLKSKLPFLQAFYTLGIKQTEEMLKRYFPQYNQAFQDVIDSMRRMTKSERLDIKTMNNIYNDLLAYIMSKTDFFGAGDYQSLSENTQDSEIATTSANKRKDFINNFPSYFKKVVSENEDIASLEFIKRLKVIRANNNNPVETVVFKNVGQLSPILKERYMRDWTTLLYMSNPKAQELALNLFRYSYYRNGFAFGPSTFIHLAPVSLRKAIPEYIETLREIPSSSDTYSDFIEQYIYNHLDNRKLVPEIPEDSSTKFTDGENNIKDEVTFIIDENSNIGDKKIIRKRFNTPEGVEYEFMNFIARKNRGNYTYYKLTLDRIDEPNVAVYRRIEPLGFQNSFIEYEYGKSVDEMSTVINQNKKDYNPNMAEEYMAFVTPNNNLDLEDNSSMTETIRESFSEEALNQAVNSVYDSSFKVSKEVVSNDNDMLSITPVEDYRDADGEIICTY